MAVSSLQYSMGISSGFKVYILEGQHSSRDPERLRPLNNHGIPVYPIKRKLSPDPPRIAKRMCPMSAPSRVKPNPPPVSVRAPAGAPLLNNCGPHFSLEQVLRRLMPTKAAMERPVPAASPDEQPLALVKRAQKPSEQAQPSPALLQQMRPSVITCVSRQKPVAQPPTEAANPSRTCVTKGLSRTPSPDVEDHFQRSLALAHKRPIAPRPIPTPQSSSISVEEHFSKALGSKWLLIRAAADSPSSPEGRGRRLV
ncbi:hypothetical protein XENTR_v10019901 [Xenopus tropicalis]|uniref:Transcription cofactor vestigial-like protein 4 n=1 Tax=Xenopus tropicalis TaxID=8364 RepID=A0A059XIA4_XENTR|nr:transcription cofactor vestigial-like protein 4 [Xenopus tropicalis]AIA21683.1 vestigia-like 4-like protein [Xenopus tropicalis]KAE8581999.1 hypothetical protein XENTR_v10019901 [Xenopus tropicalis]